MADKKTKKAEGNPLKRFVAGVKEGQQRGAQEELLQDLFNDMYAQRKKIYKMNFFRGISFGFGSVLGGTLIIALIIWILSLFVNFPLIGDYFKDAQQTIKQSTTKDR